VNRPRLLDLFCGAGGAAMGYHRAGFDVIGVDIADQPYYPFEFVRADALTFDLDGFDAVHASPPCQAYSTMGNRSRAEGMRCLPPAPDLLPETLDLLERTGLPFVCENVLGAKRLMPNAFVLSGGQFGLKVHRPRYFVSNVLILSPPKARPPRDGIGVYGRGHDGRRLFDRKMGGTYRAPRTLEEGQQAMGMDWADWHGTKEAIPPAYTEFIGAQLINHVRRPDSTLEGSGPTATPARPLVERKRAAGRSTVPATGDRPTR
jgi:DNA (cytosine-5)-methyltransferase 1